MFRSLINVLPARSSSRPTNNQSRPAPVSRHPHKCQYCEEYSFRFNAHEQHLEPYSESNLRINHRKVVDAAQNGCLLLQWILALLYRDNHDPLLRLPENAVVDIHITLQQVYDTELIPHTPNQDAPKRERWDPNHILLNYGRNHPFARYRYQAACSPYNIKLTAKFITLPQGFSVKGYTINSDSLSFCRGKHHSQDLKNDTTCITRTSLIEWDRGSRRSMRFAAKCLSKCRQADSNCQPLNHTRVGYSPRPPTRLLYVLSGSPTGRVRLIEPARLKISTAASAGKQASGNVDYAVLSYCWGGSQSLMLTGATSSYLMGGFPIEQLGQTIQDAIRVCQELNIPYLWIDALCILQDSDEDKQQELSMMSTYYQEGVLTICAASAKASTEGFLYSKEADNVYEVGPFQTNFVEGNRVATIPRRDGHYGSAHSLTNEERQERDKYPVSTKVQLFKLREERPAEPIASRAWTFQEALLSTRLLIFATSQVYWCCRERYVGCGGTHHFERMTVVHEDCLGPQADVCACGMTLMRHVEPSDLVPNVFTLANRNSMSTDAQWDLVVINFSGRALTVPEDKLIAFSAAASYFDEMFRARWPAVQYAAGLWYCEESPLSFVRQLLWLCETPGTAVRSKVYRAPTWTWACLDGQVKPFDKQRRLFHQRSSLKVLRVYTELTVPSAEFGAIKNAVLLLSGKLRSLEPFGDNGTLRPGECPVPGLQMMPDTIEDEAAIASNLNHIFLLEAAPYNSRGRSPVGIILYQLDDPEDVVSLTIPTFKRMGIFEFLMGEESGLATDIFDGCEVEEMYIV